MRQTISVIVCVLLAGSYASLYAQIPESVQFQPGSFAVPHRTFQAALPVGTVVEDDTSKTEWDKTEWEKKFGSSATESMAIPVYEQPYEVPYLTYAYDHWRKRFYVVPYEPGYAADPSAFPAQTSPLHVWKSSKSSAAGLNPQVQYMSYYDPDPVILPAEIPIRGSRIFASISTQVQPMPMPVPKPAGATPIAPPARTRIGERIRQNSGTFIVQ